MDPKLLKTWLATWQELAAPPGVRFDEPDQLAGTLNDARRDPARLEALFVPLPRGDAVLTRVREIVACEPPGWDGSYVVPAPLPAEDAELIALTEDAIARSRQLCRETDDGPIAVRRQAMSPGDWGQAALLSEPLSDRVIQMEAALPKAERTAVHFLREAVYTLTAELTVQHWILTPLHATPMQQIDPYRPHVELWRRRAKATVTWGSRFGDGITVFVAP